MRGNGVRQRKRLQRSRGIESLAAVCNGRIPPDTAQRSARPETHDDLSEPVAGRIQRGHRDDQPLERR